MNLFRDTYSLYGLSQGKIHHSNSETLAEIKAELGELGFSTRGRLHFDKEIRQKKVSYDIEGNPIYTKTLIGVYPIEYFSRGTTQIAVAKIRHHLPFANVACPNETLYYINDVDLNTEKHIYVISDEDNVYKLQLQTGKVTQLRVDEKLWRIEIKGFKYPLDYLRKRKGDPYEY